MIKKNPNKNLIQHPATASEDQKDDLKSKYNSIIDYMVLDNELTADGMKDMDKWRKDGIRAKFMK